MSASNERNGNAGSRTDVKDFKKENVIREVVEIERKDGGLEGFVNTFVTPWIMFTIKLLTVLRQATCFLPPCHTINFIFRSFTFLISMLICRRDFVSSPRGPLMVTRRVLTSIETPSGISKSSSL